MLSGPTFSTDFLTNRIMGVEPPNKKCKWENVENYLDKEANIGFSGNSMGRFLENAQLKSAAPGFMNELIDSHAFLDSSQISNPILSSNYTCGLSTNNSIGCGLSETDKFPIGNREELTTPIGLTGYDSSILLENTYLYADATHDAAEQQMLLHSRDPYPFGLANTPSTAVNQMTTTNRAELDVETLMLAEPGFLHHQQVTSSTTTTRQPDVSSNTSTTTPTTTTFEFAPSSSYPNDTGAGVQHPYMLSSQLNDPPLDDTGRQLVQEHDTAGTLNSPKHSQSLLSFDGTEMQSKTDREYLGGANVESQESTFLFQYGGASDSRKGGVSSLSASEQELRDTTLEEIYGGCMDFVRPDGHVFEERQSTPHPFGPTSESVDTRRDKASGKFKHGTTHTTTDHASANSEKRCKVCGDRAVNHNFGQLTCESCKAFFRRNAHKELTCTSKTGEHEITPSTRRECPACRLKKCFLVGMRPDLIQVRKKDFILVTNTPRLLVPTNVVTIGTATTVSTNTQAVLTTGSLSSIPRTVDLGVNLAHMSQPNLTASVPYTQYPQNTPEKQSVQTALSTDAILKDSPNQAILTPLWSPPPIQTTNIIPVANHATNSAVPTLVPSFPTCVLTTPIQSLSPQSTTLIDSTHMLNNSFTLTGTASIRLPVNTVSSSSVGAVALTAILPKTSSQVIRSENLMPNQSALLLSNTVESPIIVAQAPQPINCPTSYIGVLSQPTDWSATSTRVKSEGIPTSSLFHLTGFPDDTHQQSSVSEDYWRVSPMEQVESCIPDSSTLMKTEDPLNQLLSSSVSNGRILPADEWTNHNECSVQMIIRAWKAMWNKGVWPNPHSVNLNFGTASVNPTSWRTSIASLWIDIFLRRISTFAVHLFCSLCNKKPVDALQSLLSEAQSDASSTTGSDLGKPNRDEQGEAPWLTWSDVMWMAEHRFIDCIPILLISCLQCAKSMQVTSASGTTSTATKVPDFGPNGLCVSMGSDDFFISQVGTMQANSNCSPSRLIPARNRQIVWSSTERDSTSLDFLDSTDAQDIPRCKTDVDDTTMLSAGDEYETANEPTVHFQCDPGGHVYLSLTNLSAALAKIQTDITKHSQRGHPSYPILQYLDSYVIRFGSFLAYHPILLGAFMALKLTDPGDARPILEPQESVNPAVLTARGERDRRLRRLHEQFITVFSDAADVVALESSRSRQPQHHQDLSDHVDATQIKPEELDAANSRRAMLNDFLAWSRTFDSAWREFQRNTWVQLVQSGAGTLSDAAQRLTSFYAPDGSISHPVILDLLVESLNELRSHTS